MLKKFELKNYKNFKESLTIDFSKVGAFQFNPECLTDNIISKILIYGKNATGKTNLGTAIMDIHSNLFGYTNVEECSFLNANSQDESALFSYTFVFGNDELLYEYSKDSYKEFRDEKLCINGKQIFCCDFANGEFDFCNLECINAETLNTERYVQSSEMYNCVEEQIETRLPFLRWVISNTILQENSNILKLIEYVRRMDMISVGNLMKRSQREDYQKFFEFLGKKEELEAFEEFLNTMGVQCKLTLERLPDNQRELYFKYDKLITFYDNASSGTIALADIYYKVVANSHLASFIYIDEFDAFYHYEIAEKLVNYFKEIYPKCQIIITSHNTKLISNRLMRPDCLFILSREGKLTSLCDATTRELREGHNLEKMYIAGEFD
ncbi:MAG: AAA family ATPase [Lachnospiraceae bacterium]|nr:AAA family ATPase [Lachnospiraceae bacterium]